MSDRIRLQSKIDGLVARAATETPDEESRTSAWLAIKLMKKHGGSIQLRVETPPAPQRNHRPPTSNSHIDDWWAATDRNQAGAAYDEWKQEWAAHPWWQDIPPADNAQSQTNYRPPVSNSTYSDWYASVNINEWLKGYRQYKEDYHNAREYRERPAASGPNWYSYRSQANRECWGCKRHIAVGDQYACRAGREPICMDCYQDEAK